MATEHLMLNFLVAKATEKQNWSNNAYYMFKDGKVVHRGRQVSVTGQLPTLSFLQGKSCLNSHWSSQIVKCCSRDLKELPLIVFKEAPRQCCNSCLAMLTFRLVPLGKGQILTHSLLSSGICSEQVSGQRYHLFPL